jgi:threonine/homoserine/homoserine lactone efflux protein
MNSGYVDFAVLPGFLVAVLLICLAPGPDMAYMVATGIAGGKAAATRAALGVTVGVFIYVVAVAAGLGILITRAPLALTVAQAFGSLYLAWLAIQTFRAARRTDFTATSTSRGAWFARGLIVNLTNPKVLLFFVAFLPQFLGTAHNRTLQLLLLGLLFELVGFGGDLAVGWTAGRLRGLLLRRPRIRQGMTVTSAAVYAFLAVIVAGEATATILSSRNL